MSEVDSDDEFVETALRLRRTRRPALIALCHATSSEC